METETKDNVVAIRPAVELATYSAEALCQAVIQLTHCVVSAGSESAADVFRERREHAVRELCRRAGA